MQFESQRVFPENWYLFRCRRATTYANKLSYFERSVNPNDYIFINALQKNNNTETHFYNDMIIYLVNNQYIKTAQANDKTSSVWMIARRCTDVTRFLCASRGQTMQATYHRNKQIHRIPLYLKSSVLITPVQLNKTSWFYFQLIPQWHQLYSTFSSHLSRLLVLHIDQQRRNPVKVISV